MPNRRSELSAAALLRAESGKSENTIGLLAGGSGPMACASGIQIGPE